MTLGQLKNNIRDIIADAGIDMLEKRRHTFQNPATLWTKTTITSEMSFLKPKQIRL